jgi:putative oxidoreductase
MPVAAIANALDRAAMAGRSAPGFFTRMAIGCTSGAYALVAVGLRFVMARVFFIPGQDMIEGPVIGLNLHLPFDFSITLPMEVKEATLRLFETQSANLPLAPTTAAYLFSYAQFVLPICLVIGFATRLSALLLLVIVGLMQLYVMPDAWWSAHVYWMLILLVLITVGPGGLSLDALIRHIYEK